MKIDNRHGNIYVFWTSLDDGWFIANRELTDNTQYAAFRTFDKSLPSTSGRFTNRGAAEGWSVESGSRMEMVTCPERDMRCEMRRCVGCIGLDGECNSASKEECAADFQSGSVWCDFPDYNDYSSKEEMVRNGWLFNNDGGYTFIATNSPNRGQYCKDVPASSFCGFANPDEFRISTQLVFTGTVEISYGSTWETSSPDSYVSVNLNGDEVSRQVGKGTKTDEV